MFTLWKLTLVRNPMQEVNLGEKVVLDLLEGIVAAGRNVTCDNFFYKLIACKKVAGKKKLLSWVP